MSKLDIKVKLALLILPLAILLCVLLLRSIPAFNLRTVQIQVQGGSKVVPVAVQEKLSELVGTSLFGINLAKYSKNLETITGVKNVKLVRKLPSSLLASLTLVDAGALIKEEASDKAYLVDNLHLKALHPDDVVPWQSVAVTIEVPSSYAQMMVNYGVDDSFHQVLELARSLEGKTTLITKIKYDNNSSNSFGKMVLELSSLNAQIWVREPVGAAHVSAAVSLVQQDQKNALSFLSSQARRYDLYREGLVRR